MFRGLRFGFAATIIFVATTTYGFGQTSAPNGYTQTLRWYHERAEAGDARAQFLLAIKYETGTDVRKSLAIAADLYERAARQGHADAQFKIATLLVARERTQAQDATILSWYRAAALQGHAPAQYNLAIRLLNTAQDGETRIEAASWVIRAARAGLPQAKEMQASLLPQFSEKAAANASELAVVPLQP